MCDSSHDDDDDNDDDDDDDDDDDTIFLDGLLCVLYISPSLYHQHHIRVSYFL